MPTFKKKQFKNVFLQKQNTLKQNTLKKNNLINENKKIKNILCHTINEKLKIQNTLYKSTFYRFIQKDDFLYSKSCINVFFITENDIEKLKEKNIISIGDFFLKKICEVKVDLIVFPSRLKNNEKINIGLDKSEKKNKKTFSLPKIIRYLKTLLKKSFKCTTFDDLFSRLTNLNSNVGPILHVFSFEKISDSKDENILYKINGFLTHKLLTNKMYLNGEIPCEIIESSSEIFSENKSVQDLKNCNEESLKDLENLNEESFKDIKDLKNCKISSNYNFKEKKIILESFEKEISLLVKVKGNKIEKDIFFSVGIIDERYCLINVTFDRNNISESPSIIGINNDSVIEYGSLRFSTNAYFSRHTDNKVHKIVKKINDSGQFVCTLCVPYNPIIGSIKISFKNFKIVSSNYNFENRVLVEEKKFIGRVYKVFNNCVKIREMFDSRDDIMNFLEMKLSSIDSNNRKNKNTNQNNNLILNDLDEFNIKDKSVINIRSLKDKSDTKRRKNTVPYSRINSGKIISPVGTKGIFKAEFDRPLKMGQEVWMSLYRIKKLF